MDKGTAYEIIDALLLDMSDRCGLGDELDIIDEEVMEEMRDTWCSIIQEICAWE